MDIRYNHTRDFEIRLKEKCDEFRMYPSKRVWYSIYNNIHPGRKWPSLVTSIILIATLMLVGYLNTSERITSTSKSTDQQLAGTSPKKVVSNNNPAGSILSLSSFISRPDMKLIPTLTDKPVTVNNSYFTYSERANWHDLFLNTIDQTKALFSPVRNESENAEKEPFVISNIAEGILPIGNGSQGENHEITEDLSRGLARKGSPDKLGLQFYASPSLVYRQLSNNVFSSGDARSATEEFGKDINNVIDHKPSIGIEAGAAMHYSLSKIIKVKAGLQFNYTQYSVQAFELSHPIATTLTLNDYNSNTSYTALRSSPYANRYGLYPVTLPNKTYQVSVPMGLELKLAGKEDLQWNIGATVQPTLVMAGSAHLLSSDNRNYISESSSINRWNLNAGFETFISYKINGLTWQLGPQFRYQFSPTYNKKYTLDEKLANYGLKMGVSRILE